MKKKEQQYKMNYRHTTTSTDSRRNYKKNEEVNKSKKNTP